MLKIFREICENEYNRENLEEYVECVRLVERMKNITSVICKYEHSTSTVLKHFKKISVTLVIKNS